MDSYDIDSESLRAVKDLKSKFESLASETSIRVAPRVSPSTGDAFTATDLSSARSSSNSRLDTLVPDAGHLRTSSSSSDMKVLVKRTPPPPPPRSAKVMGRSPSPSPSPSLPSPILRPALLLPSKDQIDMPQGVAALRSKFALAVPQFPSSVLKQRPRIEAENNVSPPAIPPRPPPSLVIRRTTSPEELSDAETEKKEVAPWKPFLLPPVPVRRTHARNEESSSSPRTSMQSSFSEDGETPPPVPARRSKFDNRSINSTQSSYESDSGSSTPLSANGSPPPSERFSVSPTPTDESRTSSANYAPPPPPLPARPAPFAIPSSPASPVLSRTDSTYASVSERKPLGSSRLPPPPTRTIGLGDKLPPARRTSSASSDEDSGGEDESKMQTIDMMPDSSVSSRSPPLLHFRDGYPEPKIHIHPHSGCLAVAGTHIIVGHNHHVKIYNLAQSDSPIFTLDTKDLRPKDTKVTSMEFRLTRNEVNRGFLLWIGTKDGHIFEVDVRTGAVKGAKYAAHLHPISHILRHNDSMITLDETGKALIFSPEYEDQDVLQTIQPRIIRTTEKQDFVKIIGGKLWTAARMEHHGSGPMHRLPIIRVYDVVNARSGRSVMPTEHVGPVTSATILPSQPGIVYVGHEEGYISLWILDTDDGYPQCIEVMRVSMSDVLSLEGVNDRLWAGGRNGMIAVYDVSQRPWLVTNCWNAHPGLPVMKLLMNHFAIEKIGQLCVVSIGRDETVRFWDGLLGLDWVDKELVKLEPSFSTFHDMSVLVVSWNCDSARPDSLFGEPRNSNFLHDALHSVEEPPDIITFGFQEVVDLENRKMAAKSVLLGGKKKQDDGLSEKVTGAYKRWYDRLILAVKSAMPGEGYVVVHTENLIGLFSCTFVKAQLKDQLKDVSISTIKRGMKGRYGNKGAIVSRFVLGDSSICFVNCHLAAGQNSVRRRNADVAGILEGKVPFTLAEHPFAYVGGGDGTMILDHEFVLLNGDLNYRIDHRREAIMASIRAADISSLLTHDQLLREIKFNRACRLRCFTEGPLTFEPTYKYDRNSDEYDTSEKRRAPAWCDRILWHSRVNSRVRQLHYRRYEVNVSDHRPISAAFSVTIKEFDHAERERAKAILRANWIDEQERLLTAAAKFYFTQALL